ncbi:hypothetical protein BH23ACT9_BH23ACT9_27320 [soil metagenome]
MDADHTRKGARAVQVLRWIGGFPPEAFRVRPRRRLTALHLAGQKRVGAVVDAGSTVTTSPSRATTFTRMPTAR